MRLIATMNVPLAMPLPRDHLLPERLGVEAGMVGLGADRGRVDDHVGTRERVRARELGEPLVPARREAELRVAERDDGIAGVAGPEVAVLVVARGDRDVQLARARDERAAGRDDDRGVEAETAVARVFVERRVHVDAELGARARPRTRGCGRRGAVRVVRRLRSARRESPRSRARA